MGGLVSIGTGLLAGASWMAGFTSSGVAAGSAAAGVQAVIGNVVAGSWFAALQSAGATTVLGTAAAPVIGAAGVLGGVALLRSKS